MTSLAFNKMINDFPDSGYICIEKFWLHRLANKIGVVGLRFGLVFPGVPYNMDSMDLALGITNLDWAFLVRPKTIAELYSLKACRERFQQFALHRRNDFFAENIQ